MHGEAHAFVAQHADPRPMVALDIGGRDINGGCRGLFPGAEWTVLDIEPGEGVDIVADAATWQPNRLYDLILCTEVFEHAAAWPAICATAHAACAPGGLLILTMAGPGRAVHSGLDGGQQLYAGEHYANVDPDELRDVLRVCRWHDVVVDQLGPDVRAVARR